MTSLEYIAERYLTPSEQTSIMRKPKFLREAEMKGYVRYKGFNWNTVVEEAREFIRSAKESDKKQEKIF